MAIDLKGQSSTILLVVGGALGLAMAMWSALGVGQSLESYGNAIAVVDGVPISRTVYESAIEGLQSSKRDGLTDADRREALDRIIDEELLLRRALELGLGESDPPSRKALVNAMLQFSVAEASKRVPSESELEKFYAERPKLIAPQPMLVLRAVSLPQSATARAQSLKAALDSGADFDAAARKAGAEAVLLPGGPVIPAKIAEYAGATIRDTALSMTKGQIVGPVAVADRLVFIYLIDRAETPPPPLAAVHDVVVEEWQKRESEQAFADYVEGLRRRARISYASDAPAAGKN
jgi:parvulin-like peptidyl-prolyl isomerase